MVCARATAVLTGIAGAVLPGADAAPVAALLAGGGASDLSPQALRSTAQAKASAVVAKKEECGWYMAATIVERVVQWMGARTS